MNYILKDIKGLIQNDLPDKVKIDLGGSASSNVCKTGKRSKCTMVLSHLSFHIHWMFTIFNRFKYIYFFGYFLFLNNITTIKICVHSS